MSEEVKDQAAEVEKNECCCGCGCQDANAPEAPAKKSNNNIVRIVVWAVVAVVVVLFCCFRGSLIEYFQRSKNIAMITEDAKKNLGYEPFKIEALGDYKFKVTVKEKPADTKKVFNEVNFQVKDGVLDFVSEQDRTNWINMSEINMVRAQKDAEKPAEAAK